jgi:ABC-type lipoprotein export system ATPase subunit
VTHDPRAAARAHRLLHLDKGVLSAETHAAAAQRSRESARP